MTQVNLILEKKQLAPEHWKIYEAIFSSRGNVSEMFGLLLHDPALADRIALLGQQIRFESSLPENVKETVILIVAAELPGSYFWQTHVPLARAVGISDKTISLIQRKEQLPGDDGQIATYVRNVITCHRQQPELGASLLKRFGTLGMISLTATVSYYVMMISIMTAFDLTDRVS